MNQDYIFQEEDDDLFFDSRDDISSVSDSCPSSPSKNGLSLEDQFISWPSNNPRFEVWIKDPVSVRERRDKFMKILGVDVINNLPRGSDNLDEELKVDGEIQPGIDRVMSNRGAVLRSSCSRSKYSMSSWSSEDTSTLCDGVFEEGFVCRIKNLDDGTVFVVDDLDKDGGLRSLREVGSNRTLTFHEFERNFGPSSLIQQLMRRDIDAPSTSEKSVRKKRTGWLRRLGAAVCIVDRQQENSSSSISDSCGRRSTRPGRIKVHLYKKQSKELSAVYNGQNFKAHDGAILTMKFSPDGEYLATGGKDGVVRMWHVMECRRTGEMRIPGNDPSCIYFTVNRSSELTPLYVDKDKKPKSTNSRITSKSVCVIIPPDAFRLSEVPLHEFHGHCGDVLDLSWSNNKCLLSSSVDKTVRMWKIGSDTCVKVFPHNNYVTCVQFNPNNEDYFISGSIDGKVRIWEISRSQVMNWVDVREIITAVCYRPDGKGAVVGTMAGNCRFYDASDNHLQLDAQVFLQGKKKSALKRITGIQFCPSDPHKLMVSSADSQIRVLDGFDVTSKFKGSQKSGSQIFASFTADGQHIISAGEDSNVYMWSYASHAAPSSKHGKSTWCSERFFSSDATIAIPWYGLQSEKSAVPATSEVLHSRKDVFRDKAAVTSCSSDRHVEDLCGNDTFYLSPSRSFSLSHEFLECLPKGSATWPEEKLPSSFASSTLDKSHYKFLRTSCQNTSHAWGQVIVTAGVDGWIRSYQNYGLPQCF
nr:PREDICTED: WD repeat-containing protein 44-like [Musa acuminata subsp. malaccensis]XP_018678840.1 PREDICTED: WD repeat-containing protein 44-like [Musa acuminata subsp. malaccensis]